MRQHLSRHMSLPGNGAAARAAWGSEPDEELSDRGFTLIELMVVLLIMGILMAIAIPSFLSTSNAANDRSAQSNLTNVMLSAKSLYAQNATYPSTNKLVTIESASEPELSFTTGVSSGVDDISLYSATTTPTPNPTLVYLAVWVPQTEICWVAEDTAKSKGVRYGYTSYRSTTTPTPQSVCTGATVGTAISTPGSGWHDAYPAAPPGH